MWTFQVLIKEAAEAGTDAKEAIASATSTVMEHFKHDAALRALAFYTQIIKDIIWDPLMKVVMPAVKAILEPINDAVPDAMKQFLNVFKVKQFATRHL